MDALNDAPVEQFQAAEPGETSSFVSLRFWLAGSPWQVTGGWLLLAGLVAAAGLDGLQQPLLPLLLTLLLAGPVWGALWSQLLMLKAWPGSGSDHRPLLPYVSQTSPAGRLLGWGQPGALSAIVRGGLPLVGLALLVGVLVGRLALVLSGAALALAILGNLAHRARLAGLVYWLQALVQSALPFGLGVSLAGPWPSLPQGGWLVGLAAGFTLLARASAELAVYRTPSDDDSAVLAAHRSLLLIASAGSAIVVGVMLAAQQPLAGGVLALIAAAPLLLVVRPARAAARFANFWWWLLVMGAALALGLGIG